MDNSLKPMKVQKQEIKHFFADLKQDIEQLDGVLVMGVRF